MESRTWTVSDFSNNYQGTGTWTDTDFTKSHIDFMFVLPMLVDQEILRHIWEQRPLLGVKLGCRWSRSRTQKDGRSDLRIQYSR
jgi:hypothetical protein